MMKHAGDAKRFDECRACAAHVAPLPLITDVELFLYALTFTLLTIGVALLLTGRVF